MNWKELQRAAKNYFNGTATTDEKEMLDCWYDKIHSGEQVEEVFTDTLETEAALKQHIFENIQIKINSHNSGVKKINSGNGIVKNIILRVVSAAAIIFIAVGAVWHFYLTGIKTSTRVELVNITAKKIMKVTLPDGSIVWLSAHTVFKYPNIFVGKVREVELVEGRAFFDVKHQSNHPFMVKTKSLNITVLGTSFDVHTYKGNGTTKVSVITGKVGVTRPDRDNEAAVMILPKQQVVVSTGASEVKKEVTKEAVVNLWCKNPLVFEQESLENVFKAIEKKYNTQIKVDNKKLLKEQISITLSNQRLDTIMQILSFTKNFNYQIANDSTVVIK